MIKPILPPAFPLLVIVIAPSLEEEKEGVKQKVFTCQRHTISHSMHELWPSLPLLLSNVYVRIISQTFISGPLLLPTDPEGQQQWMGRATLTVPKEK